MSKIEVNAIEPQCGTNLTVGASGDTITFPSGTTVVNNGSQTGFGRTGTVDWDTTAKTASFTAVSGNGYFVNTTSGAITVTLPAGSAGSIVAFKDYLGTFDSNALTIAPNGSQKINGNATIDLLVDTEGESVTLVYADDTQGWLVVNDGNNDAGSQAQYITATGGTITTVCTNFKVHTFTGPGTFTVCSVGNAAGSNTVDYLVVAAGGGGGYCMGGGGGGGGYRESSGAASGSYSASPLGACVSALPVSVQGYPITIGSGGGGGTSNNDKGCSGSNSIFSTITSAGGGGGGARPNSPDTTLGIAGGSGGGNANDSPPSNTNPAGNTPPVSPPQGQPGGFGRGDTGINKSGGGGGATTAGGDGGPGEVSGPGGAGATSSINATPTGRAGGGSGGIYATGGHSKGTASDGGGVGGPSATNGTANTGGGGGGAGHSSDPGTQNGGTGGSGIVIIRYKFQ
jgi:hypothetical protein